MTVFEARERKGMQEGIQKGIEMNKEKSAQNMLKDGLPVELVAEQTEFSVAEVKKLREKLG